MNKIKKWIFSAVKFFNFISTAWIRIRIDLKCWILIRIRIKTNAHPHSTGYGTTWNSFFKIFYKFSLMFQERNCFPHAE